MSTSSPSPTETQLKQAGHEEPANPAIWLGYAPTGGRVYLRHDAMRGRFLLAGQRADDLASLLAFAMRESELSVLVLDTDGAVSRQVSGYMEAYDYTCFLHDAFRIEEEEDGSMKHGQLIAAAYASAMGLSAEEEAIVSAGMQHLALRDRLATPAVLFAALDAVEGFRGFYVDKLKGRVGSLKFLESAENGALSSVLSLGGCVIRFDGARYPQAMEVASAVFLAKILAMLPNAKTVPDVILVSGAHRIFRALPSVQHSERLLMEMLDSRAVFVLSSDQPHALSATAMKAFPNKILSSDIWNEGVEWRWKGNAREPVLPSAYVIADGHFGQQSTFIARSFEPSATEPRRGPLVTEGQAREQRMNDELTVIILQDIKRYEAPTRASVIEYLSGEYGTEAVEHELDRLFAQECIRLETRESRSGGPPMLVYRITEQGNRVLEAREE